MPAAPCHRRGRDTTGALCRSWGRQRIRVAGGACLIRTGIGLVGVIALIGSAVAGALVFLVLISISFGGGSLVFMRACGSPISLAVAIVALAVAIVALAVAAGSRQGRRQIMPIGWGSAGPTISRAAAATAPARRRTAPKFRGGHLTMVRNVSSNRQRADCQNLMRKRRGMFRLSFVNARSALRVVTSTRGGILRESAQIWRSRSVANVLAIPLHCSRTERNAGCNWTKVQSPISPLGTTQTSGVNFTRSAYRSSADERSPHL